MSQNQDGKTQIERLVGKYIDGINQSKTDLVLPLFTQDGVVMGADAPTMEGVEQLKAFFDHGFALFNLESKIEIDEIIVSGDYAIARSHAQVQVTELQTNVSHPEQTRELFVFKKDGSEWKIARYMFNKMPSALS